MTAPHTRERLAQDARALGIAADDVLFVHSSFKSLGPVEGGAETVIRALEDAIGPRGTLCMPSFNLKNQDREGSWNHQTTPASTGWLTEYFRTLPGTVRSDHYSHSVASRGPRAAEFVSEHLRREGRRSPWDRDRWGYTYGCYSPMEKIYAAGGKVLMLGVDYTSATFCHIVEVRHWNERLAQDPQAPFRYLCRPWLGAYWDSLGRLRRGRIGDADCRFFAARDFVDTLLAAVNTDPDRWDKWSPRYETRPRPETGFPDP